MNIGKTGLISFQNYHGRTKGKIGSSVIRVDWLLNHWKEAEEWGEGKKFDNMIFQKVYWQTFMEDYKGIKILDLCDPDWLGGDLKLKEISEYVDAFTCSSQGLTDFVKDKVDRPCITVPDRVNLDLFPVQKSHFERAKTVVWFGYLKNGSKMLDSLLPLLAHHNLSLLIVSDTPYRTSMSFGVNIHNINWIPQSAYYDIQQGDMVINPVSKFGRFKYKSNNKTVISWALGLPVAENEDDLVRFIDPEERNKEVKEKFEIVKKEYDVNLSIAQYKNLIWDLKKERTK